jgi:hypothetical protein
MEQADQELLRRTLMAVVKRIESGGSTSVVMSEQPDQSSARDKRQETTEPPIILIMLGQAGSTNEPVCENQASHEAGAGGKIRSDVSHPGFEKFQISDARPAGVPKSCFMEPDRICVNSGACEMLGN